MNEQKKDDFEFEVEGEEREVTPVQKPDAALQQEAKGKPDVDFEIEDDTPEEDRGRTPLPENIVKELEADELEEYSDRARTRLKQLKKVWHDERRAKDAADREREEAISLAQRIIAENKHLKQRLTAGQKSFIDTAKSAAELEIEMAKRAYKEAYEGGDADRIVDAQEKLSSANFKLERIKSYRPPLQREETEVNSVPETPQVARPDPKAASWQEKNQWFGRDRVMTALALGMHEELVAERGQAYATTDEYYDRIDKTIRSKFPEKFGDEVQTTNGGGKSVTRTEKYANVVAPASRSTSSKKIVLKQSEVNIAKRFGLTPEQYAKEKMRLENQNG